MRKTTLTNTRVINYLIETKSRLEEIETYYLSNAKSLDRADRRRLYSVQYGIDTASDTLRHILELTKK